MSVELSDGCYYSDTYYSDTNWWSTVPGLDYIHVYSPFLVVLDFLLAHGPSIPRCTDFRKELPKVP